jgi:putative Mg2+ transporter-C (MgtC) family protein
MLNLDWIDIAMRLGGAVLAGAILGINRDLHHKPAGLRTHSLVSLGSAVVVVAVASLPGASADAVARVIQGLVTGVGFIGAGVILHHDAENRVVGLTTAASIWVAAALGTACGAGFWIIAVLALAFTLAVLTLGGPIESAWGRLLGTSKDDGPASPDA